MEASVSRIRLTAHAGCMGTKKDSLESVSAGIQAGADLLEVDVRFLDGVPVLSHNPIRAYDSGGLVTLDMVFDTVREVSGVDVNLDIKERGRREFTILNRAILSANMEARVLFSDITPDRATDVDELCSGIPYYISYDPLFVFTGGLRYIKKIVRIVKNTKACGINLFYRFATPKLVEAFHQAGLQVFVWTVDRREDMVSMIHRKVNSITTCRIDLLRDLLLQKEMEQGKCLE